MSLWPEVLVANVRQKSLNAIRNRGGNSLGFSFSTILDCMKLLFFLKFQGLKKL